MMYHINTTKFNPKMWYNLNKMKWESLRHRACDIFSSGLMTKLDGFKIPLASLSVSARTHRVRGHGVTAARRRSPLMLTRVVWSATLFTDLRQGWFFPSQLIADAYPLLWSRVYVGCPFTLLCQGRFLAFERGAWGCRLQAIGWRYIDKCTK